MTNKTLKVWGNCWKKASLNPEVFNIKISWFARTAEFSGFAYKYKGKWYAVWKDADKLIFQTNSGKWIIGDGECLLTNLDNGKKKLHINSPNKHVLSVEYTSLSNLNDSSHDLMDEEMNDFFFWLYRVWNDSTWAEALLIRYT